MMIVHAGTQLSGYAKTHLDKAFVYLPRHLVAGGENGLRKHSSELSS
jgi:hypothetical protein